MSGIAVVIDDAFKADSPSDNDRIFQLVESIERKWEIPFYKIHEIPSDEICNNLLQSASFILLDWKLWPSGSQELEKEGIQNNIKFLQRAKDYFVPVFIFTNESLEDIIDTISKHNLYDRENIGKNFIFIKQKSNSTGANLFLSIQGWVTKSTSVYTLKAWEKAFHEARKKLFNSMYEKSPSWPRVFWSSYKKDGVDPSSSFVNLINNNMLARMEPNIFEESVLGRRPYGIGAEDVKSVLEGTTFIPQERLPANDIKAGDIFNQSGRNYIINIRADCDCIPRNKQNIGDIDLYCIQGKTINTNSVIKSYNKKNGNFNERVWEAIVFMAHNGKTIRFDFREFSKKKYSDIKQDRVGRLIHPYITRIQQRYALYLQRQGLPRIPEKAIETE